MISTQRSRINLLMEIRDTLLTLMTAEELKKYGSAAIGANTVYRAVLDGDGNIGGGTDKEYHSAVTVDKL